MAQSKSLTALSLLIDEAWLENEELKKTSAKLQEKCELMRNAVAQSRSEEVSLREELEQSQLVARKAHESRDSVLGAKYVIKSRLEDERKTIDTAAQRQVQRTHDELRLATAELERLQATVDEMKRGSDEVAQALVDTKLSLAQAKTRSDALKAAVVAEKSRQLKEQPPLASSFMNSPSFLSRFQRRRTS